MSNKIKDEEIDTVFTDETKHEGTIAFTYNGKMLNYVPELRNIIKYFNNGFAVGEDTNGNYCMVSHTRTLSCANLLEAKINSEFADLVYNDPAILLSNFKELLVLNNGYFHFLTDIASYRLNQNENAQTISTPNGTIKVERYLAILNEILNTYGNNLDSTGNSYSVTKDDITYIRPIVNLDTPELSFLSKFSNKRNELINIMQEENDRIVSTENYASAVLLSECGAETLDKAIYFVKIRKQVAEKTISSLSKLANEFTKLFDNIEMIKDNDIKNLVYNYYNLLYNMHFEMKEYLEENLTRYDALLNNLMSGKDGFGGNKNIPEGEQPTSD